MYERALSSLPFILSSCLKSSVFTPKATHFFVFYSSFIHYPLSLSFFFDTHAIYSYYRHSRSFCLSRVGEKPEGATNQNENCLDTPSYRSNLRARSALRYQHASDSHTRRDSGEFVVRVQFHFLARDPARSDQIFFNSLVFTGARYRGFQGACAVRS